MESWVKLSIWIGIFGFFKEFRPEDPYIIQYLTGPKMNFTDEQVMEVFYGTMSSTEVAYYTYIYAKVDPQYFQQVTSYMRASVLTGRFLSSVVSQIFLFWKIMTIDELNDLTLVGMICAFFWALGLPSVPRSLYFHREVLPAPNNGSIGVPSESTSNGVHRNGAIPSTTPKTEPPSRSCCSSSSYVLGFLWDDFKFAFTNMYVIKWSVWVAVGTCGYTQFMGYIILFSVPIESPPPIQPRNSH
uniref:Thiamine transporter 2 n=1 Tax=Cacopsylla melanoneura TaxID=428564 RepID=A0A8D8MC90_9HEMI